MGAFNEKLKEVVFSVVPVTTLVLVLHFVGYAPLETQALIRFLIGAAMLILGLALFLLGTDLGATPIGRHSGEALVRTNRLLFVAIGGFFLGFLINIAEPDLAILANEVAFITDGAFGRWDLVLVVSVGVGLLVAIGLLRIVKNWSLRTILWITYGLIFIAALFVEPIFHAFAFDASGATTGAITVPFLLAVAIGTSRHRSHLEEDASASFGMAGLASAGAILGVLLRGLFASFADLSETAQEPVKSVTEGIVRPFLDVFAATAWEAFLSLLPLAIVFVLLRFSQSGIRRRQAVRITVGLVYCFLGLVLFLVGVKGGFMPAGTSLGSQLAARNQDGLLLAVGLFIGMLTILAEPAVHVLTHQIETETAGNIPRRLVLFFLSAGVSLSLVLSLLRIIFRDLQLWHMLLPGYTIIFILSLFCPPLFIGIAFDAGGVASGPITATFILAFAQGAAEQRPGANVILDGFGVIALVAMMPLIALQLLGILHKIRTRRKTAPLEEDHAA